MAMADTGLKSGIGANRMRPAAARLASTTMGMVSRRRGRRCSKEAKNAARETVTTTKLNSPAWSMPAAAQTASPSGTIATATASSAEATVMKGLRTGARNRSPDR